jgi:hypothetical protein
MDAGAASTLSDLIRRMLGNPEAGWSLGTFGAIAEFHHVEGDPAPHVQLMSGGGEVVTARGAIRVHVDPQTRAVAYEGLSRRRDAWTQGVAFCLPEGAAAMGGRSVLTDLGPDREAARSQDRTAILFDIGIGMPHLDFCVRTRDRGLIRLLRQGIGASILTRANPQIEAIKRSSPSRVCMSRLGRIEVFQHIGSHRRQMPAPTGPHTHLYPALLQKRNNRRGDHGGESAVPEGWLSALDLYPGNPVTDRSGRARPFDIALHTAFQELLERHALPGYMEEKLLVAAAVVAGMEPHQFPEDEGPATRLAKQMAWEVTLRQMLHTHPEITPVRTWLAALDHATSRRGPDIAH